MDAYLESLVKKPDEATSAVIDTEALAEEIAQNSEPTEETINSVAEESSAIEIDSVEPDKQSLGENGDPSVVTDINASTVTKNQSVNNSLQSGEYKPGETYYVTNIRIYKTPDVTQIARNYTGNVVYKGRIEDVYIIEYMRHGFGLVRGYTLDLN